MSLLEHRNIPGLFADSGEGTVEDPYLGTREKGGVTYSLAWWYNDPEKLTGFNSTVQSASTEPKPEEDKAPAPKPKSQKRRRKTQNKPKGDE